MIEICFAFSLILIVGLIYRLYFLQEEVKKATTEYNNYYFSRLNNMDSRFSHLESMFKPVYSKFRTMINGEASLKNELKDEIVSVERHLQIVEDQLRDLIVQIRNRIEQLEVSKRE